MLCSPIKRASILAEACSLSSCTAPTNTPKTELSLMSPVMTRLSPLFM